MSSSNSAPEMTTGQEPVSSRSSASILTSALSASSIDQLTLSYLKGEISFQEYETLIENQHFLAITNNSASQLNDQSSLVSSTIELASNDAIAEEDEGRDKARTTPTTASVSLLDRFFSLKNILDEEEEEENDEGEEDDEVEDSGNLTADESTTNQWNDFDIETLNFDNFIKDHQTSDKQQAGISGVGAGARENKARSSNERNKRKKGQEDTGEGADGGGGTQGDDQNELKAKRRVSGKFGCLN